MSAFGIVASTTQEQDQQPLVDGINEVATVANANDVVTLPAAVTDRICKVVNNGTNSCRVYCASGEYISDTLNAYTDLPAGKTLNCICYSTGKWVAFSGTFSGVSY